MSKHYAIVFILFLSLRVNATDIPREWIENTSQDKSFSFFNSNAEDLSNLENKVNNLSQTHTNLVNRLANKYPKLERFDASLGISSSGELGIFSFGKSSAVELIWERTELAKEDGAKEDIIDTNVAINPLDSEKTIADKMLKSLEAVVDFKNIRSRVRRKIVSTLFKDASRVNFLTMKILSTQQVGQWYIDGFWRNYYFSKSFGLLDVVNIGYSKRIRFRFNVKQTPYRLHEDEKTEGDRLLISLMQMFNRIQAEEENNKMEFYRVWASLDFNLGFDILIFSKSIGKGYLVEFKKAKSYIDNTDIGLVNKISSKLVSKITNTFNNLLSRANTDGELMHLNQARYIFGISKEFDIQLVSLEKASDLNFQFKRKKESIAALRYLEANDAASLVLPMKSRSDKQIRAQSFNLKQIDYRHRASFSFSIPFINRIRIRPSYEYRYGVK